MKITSKTIAIISSIVVAGSAGGMYYLSNQDEPEVLAWVDTSWTFRRSVDVANSSGDTLTNEDVLITLDTASLVSANKLQSDCDDLRLVDTDDATYLSFWLENECNVSETRIWVQVPSLPDGGKSIYVYYGNDSAVNTEESWSGNFISLNDDTCPTGWSYYSTLDQKFPLISATAGTTGGADSHTHGNYSRTTGGSGGSGIYWRSGTTAYLSSTHAHSYTIVTNSSSVLPPYLDIPFCASENFNPNTGMITLFLNTVPTGWTRFSALDSKFPRSNETYGGTGGASTHKHTFNSGTTGSAGPSPKGSGSYYQAGKSTHTHTWSGGDLSTNNNIPPYKAVVWGESNDATLLDGILMLATAVPPLGWTQNNSVDEYFPYGSASYGTTGGASTHTHTVPSGSTNTVGGSGSVGSGTGLLCGPSHSHNLGSFTTNSQSNYPPYISFNLVERKTSVAITVQTEETSNTTTNPPSSLLTEGETNPTLVVDTTPEFSAVFSDPDAEDTGNFYRIQVNTNQSFNGTEMWDSTKTALDPVLTNGARSPDISYAGTTLAWGTTYYWRMKFWDNNEFASESPWSATANFTMNHQANAPTSLLTEGSTNPLKTSLTPYFSAIFEDGDATDTGTHYQILVNTAYDFTGTTMWDSTKTQFGSPITNGSRSSNITYAGTTLEEGTAYYWKIRFWDENDLESVYSGVANFLTESGPSAPSGLLFDGRPNPTYLLSTTPPFSAIYSDINGDSASAYQINVNSNNLFTGTVIWDSGKQSITVANGARSSDITYDGTELINSKNIYYWRIRFWDSDDMVGEWSSTSYFTDSTVPQFIMEGLSLQGIKID